MNKLILVGAIVFFSLAFVAAQDYNCPMGGMMYGVYGGYGTGMMFLYWLLYLAVIALIIAGIYWLIKSAGKSADRRK